MYSKNQAAQLKSEFWTAFGVYMKPVLSANGLHINWVNYKTGIKNIYFRTDATKNNASVSIELRGVEEERLHHFKIFTQLQSYFNGVTEAVWTWQQIYYDDDGAVISKIFINLDGVSIFKKEDWPSIISFLKKHIIALDDFWSFAKIQFEP